MGTPAFEHSHVGYSDIEIQKIKRTYDWMIAPQDEELLNKRRSNFYRYFEAHDGRRGTNFLKTFPEFKDFYNECKQLTQ